MSKFFCMFEIIVDSGGVKYPWFANALKLFKQELWHTLVSFSFVMFNTLIYKLVSPVLYVR